MHRRSLLLLADADPAVTLDGSSLIFASQRPPRSDTFSLYKVFLTGARSGSVVPLPNSANQIGDQFYPSVSNDGTLYVTVNTKDGYRLYSVGSVTEQNAPATPFVLPGAKTAAADFDETVAPDGRFIVFASDRAGGSDLYVSMHTDGRWCAPERLPAPINATDQMATGLSRDVRTLYFASSRTDLKMPTARPMNASEFRAMLAHYRNNSLHTIASTSTHGWTRRSGSSRADVRITVCLAAISLRQEWNPTVGGGSKQWPQCKLVR